MLKSALYKSFMIYLLFSASAIFAKPIDLSVIFTKNDSLPAISADKFISGDLRRSFKWLTKDKKQAHFPAYLNSYPVMFLGHKVWEVNIRFADNKFRDAEISFYNRGDAGQIDEKKFKEMLAGIDEKVSEWIPVKPKLMPKKRLPNNIGSIETKVWVKGDLLASLIWSASNIKKSRDQKPEYIKLEISKLDPKKDPRKMYIPKSYSKKDKMNPKDSIKKNENGDVFIDGIPMVDQGQKGYCAVAVTERILRYYGQDIDQHVIAEMATSSAEKGTNSGTMLDMVKKAGVKFKVKVKVYKAAMHSGELTRDMQKYNKLLKRKKRPLVKIPPLNSNFFSSIYDQIKRDIESFKEYKCEKCKTDYNRFRKTIIKSIDQGIPIVWGVTLGLIREGNFIPQTAGGHLRLIIGYNKKTDEIVFSDTWGARHEFKKMEWKNAWCITTSYAAITPR